MKKKLLAFALASLGILGLISTTGCGCQQMSDGQTPGGDPTPEPEPEPGPGPEQEEHLCYVTFYVDFNNTDPEDVYDYFSFDTRTKRCPETSKGIPACPDPAYPTWLGWSEHSQVNSPDQIFDFANTEIAYTKAVLTFYGIWVAE